MSSLTGFAETAAASRLAIALLAVFWLPAAAAPAEDDEGEARDISLWVVEYENDIFSGEDRYYSNGVRLSRIDEARSAPSWLESVARRFPGFDEATGLPYGLSISHNIYTPADIRNPRPPPEDRPYAAWLQAKFATGTLHPRGADRVRVGLGIVGPAALGRQVQNRIHTWMDSPRPRGWDNQLRNEVTLQVGYDRFRRMVSIGKDNGVGFDAAWLGGLSLGNAYTHLTLGGFARLGRNLPDDYGPPRNTPAISGSGYFRPEYGVSSWYLYAGIEGRQVFRDLFLQGNSFGGGDGVAIERQVGEAFAGLVFSRGPFRVSYIHSWRTREFANQLADQNYGALSLSLWW